MKVSLIDLPYSDRTKNINNSNINFYHVKSGSYPYLMTNPSAVKVGFKDKRAIRIETEGENKDTAIVFDHEYNWIVFDTGGFSRNALCIVPYKEGIGEAIKEVAVPMLTIKKGNLIIYNYPEEQGRANLKDARLLNLNNCSWNLKAITCRDIFAFAPVVWCRTRIPISSTKNIYFGYPILLLKKQYCYLRKNITTGDVLLSIDKSL